MHTKSNRAFGLRPMGVRSNAEFRQFVWNHERAAVPDPDPVVRDHCIERLDFPQAALPFFGLRQKYSESCYREIICRSTKEQNGRPFDGAVVNVSKQLELAPVVFFTGRCHRRRCWHGNSFASEIADDRQRSRSGQSHSTGHCRRRFSLRVPYS